MYGSFFGAATRSKEEDNEQQQEESSTPYFNDEESADSNAQQQQDGGSASLISCGINLANTIVGAGMLGLPGAFGGTGYIGGSILITLGALFSAHGLNLLSKAAQKAGLPSSFYSVARATVPQYTILIDLAVALKCFGVATGYLITVSDCMVDAFDHLLLTGDSDHDDSFIIQTILSREFWVVGAILAVLPVSFYRTFDELKKASALALVFVFFLAFGIIAYANGLADPCLDQSLEDCQGEVVPFTDAPRTLAKLPIFVFAFTCQQNIFPIVNEITNRTQGRLNMVIVCSIGFAFVLFFTVAVEGYRTFGSNVRGDVLLNYPGTGKVTLLRICIAFMLTLHYPLQLDPSRRCITDLVKVVRQWWQERGQSSRQDSALNSSDIDTPRESILNDSAKVLVEQQSNAGDDGLFYPITVAFLLLSFLLAMVVDDLGIVLALVGATGSTLVSYILPGLIYVKIHPSMDAAKVGAYIQLALGCMIMPVALYFVFAGKASH